MACPPPKRSLYLPTPEGGDDDDDDDDDESNVNNFNNFWVSNNDSSTKRCVRWAQVLVIDPSGEGEILNGILSKWAVIFIVSGEEVKGRWWRDGTILLFILVNMLNELETNKINSQSNLCF